MASTRRAPPRSLRNKRRIPLALLPYTSSESEAEEEEAAVSVASAAGEESEQGDDDSEAPVDAAQLGGMMLRQRAANACVAQMAKNGMAPEPLHDKRRKVAAMAGQCKSSPLRASTRVRQTPVREGMVDITQKGLSFAHSGAPGKQATAERPGVQKQQSAPAASAASANCEGMSLALRLDSPGRSDAGSGSPGTARSGPAPKTPLGAPPAPRSAATDSRLPAPGQIASTRPCPPSAMKNARASDSLVERTARASVTWRDDVMSPTPSRVRLHKEARRQSEELLGDSDASDLNDRFSEVAEPKPPSPAQTRRRASLKAGNAQRRSAGCTDKRSL